MIIAFIYKYIEWVTVLYVSEPTWKCEMIGRKNAMVVNNHGCTSAVVSYIS